MKNQKTIKKVKELFVDDLRNVRGGAVVSVDARKPRCPQFTTLACGEEAYGCSGC